MTKFGTQKTPRVMGLASAHQTYVGSVTPISEEGMKYTAAAPDDNLRKVQSVPQFDLGLNKIGSSARINKNGGKDNLGFPMSQQDQRKALEMS